MLDNKPGLFGQEEVQDELLKCEAETVGNDNVWLLLPDVFSQTKWEVEKGIVSPKEDLFASLGLRGVIVLVMLNMPDVPVSVELAVQLDVYIVSLYQEVEILFANG